MTVMQFIQQEHKVTVIGSSPKKSRVKSDNKTSMDSKDTVSGC